MSKKYNTDGAVKFLHEEGTPFTKGTLQVWRSQKKGPEFIKIGSKVFYSEEALRRLAAGTVIKTVDSVGA